jgi:hypothetical protein
MNRLRVVGRRGRCGIAPLAVAEKTALDVAADATLNGQDLAAMQVQALTNAAAHVLRSQDELRAAIADRGQCANGETDPEDWFPAYDEDSVAPVDSPLRGEIRSQAATLCFGCPVKGQCLALSYELGEQGSHGIWGGLGARDRVELRGLWIDLRERLTLPADQDQDGPADEEQDGGSVAVAS